MRDPHIHNRTVVLQTVVAKRIDSTLADFQGVTSSSLRQNGETLYRLDLNGRADVYDVVLDRVRVRRPVHLSQGG